MSFFWVRNTHYRVKAEMGAGFDVIWGEGRAPGFPKKSQQEVFP